MKTKNTTRARGLRADVLSVLTNEWQSTSLIASQLAIPPDVVARSQANMKLWCNRRNSIAGTRSMIVGRELRAIVLSGKAEKRYVSGKRCEFRLPQPNEKAEDSK